MFIVCIKCIYAVSFSKHQASVPILSINLFVHTSVCVFTFEVPFKRLFAPTSQSWISKSFRALESLVKGNAKKWFQIWNCLLIGGIKLQHKKSLFWCKFCLTEQDFVGIGVSHSVKRSFFHLTKSNIQTFRFSESFGKSNEQKCGLRFENFCSYRV